MISRFPTCSLSRPSASSTPLAVTRSNPCTSAQWSGMSGCLANPTPHTLSNEEERGKEGEGKGEGGRLVYRRDEGEQKREGSQRHGCDGAVEYLSTRKNLIICGKKAGKWRRTSWRSTSSKRPRWVLTKDVVSRWNGESSHALRDISLECEAKPDGRESTHGSGDEGCFEAETCRQVKQKKRRGGSSRG